MKQLGDLMKDALGRPEVLKAARGQSVLRRWSEAVGPMLAEKVTPDSVDHGVIWVSADSGAWAQEVVMQRQIILERLNEMAGEKLFTDIRAARPRHRKFETRDDAPRT